VRFSSLGSTSISDHLFLCAVSVEQHLLHPHVWVRLVSSQLLGFFFASLDAKAIADKVLQKKKSKKRKMSNGTSDDNDYWHDDPAERVRSLPSS
jgi:hypothetical protein